MKKGNENAFAALREAKAAKASIEAGWSKRGAVVSFPTTFEAYVEATRDGKPVRLAPWPLTVSHEPGAAFPAGVTDVSFSASPPGWRIEGRFSVIVGPGGSAPDATITMRRVPGGPKLPEPPLVVENIRAALVPAQNLHTQLGMLARKEEWALDFLVRNNKGLVVQIVNKVFSRNSWAGHDVYDRDDAMTDANRELLRLAHRFASNDRPTCSWSRALMTNCSRNVTRELHRAAPGRWADMDCDGSGRGSVSVFSFDPNEIGQESSEILASELVSEDDRVASIAPLIRQVFGTADQLLEVLPWLFQTGLIDDSDVLGTSERPTQIGHTMLEVAEMFDGDCLSAQTNRRFGRKQVAEARSAFFSRFARDGESADQEGMTEVWEARAMRFVRECLYGA